MTRDKDNETIGELKAALEAVIQEKNEFKINALS